MGKFRSVLADQRNEEIINKILLVCFVFDARYDVLPPRCSPFRHSSIHITDAHSSFGVLVQFLQFTYRNNGSTIALFHSFNG